MKGLFSNLMRLFLALRKKVAVLFKFPTSLLFTLFFVIEMPVNINFNLDGSFTYNYHSDENFHAQMEREQGDELK